MSYWVLGEPSEQAQNRQKNGKPAKRVLPSLAD
jgi:hypothetical protein